jgi:Fur family ferric uptake transcriptional regulator
MDRAQGILKERGLRAILKEHGLRATRGRLDVLGLILRAGRPLSQKDIMSRASVPLDRASLYRMLHAFVKEDIVHRAYAGGRSPLFESPDRCGSRHCHPHFSCRSCGATMCLDGLNIHAKGRLQKGFVVERQKVLIEGLCPKCS